jgi:hypothetical protein
MLALKDLIASANSFNVKPMVLNHLQTIDLGHSTVVAKGQTKSGSSEGHAGRFMAFIIPQITEPSLVCLYESYYINLTTWPMVNQKSVSALDN